MDDLVERLRLFEQDPRFGDGMLVRNAADEIERLRAELAAIKGQEPVGEMTGHHRVGVGEMPTIMWAKGYWPTVGTKLYALPVAPVADNDAERIAKLERILEEEGFVRCPSCGSFDTGSTKDANGEPCADYCKECNHAW